MPFDLLPAATATRIRNTRPLALWLFGLCAMVLVMVTLGGATRLTGSGLSIMEWAPIMGALPPLSDAEWHRLYALYQQIPQYDLVNRGFGLDGFKGIFWLEWTHRLWGRLMGLAFIGPLAWFAVRGRIDRRLALRLVALLVLGGLQGLVGWVMVASGFQADRTAVSAYRLVAHLVLAVTLYAALLWTALDLWRRPCLGGTPLLRRLTGAVTVMVALTMTAGGFVAGLKAGLTYNTFPLMDGRWVPSGIIAMRPLYLNLFENVPTVQFDHRLLATLTAALALGTALYGLVSTRGRVRAAMAWMGAAVAAQYALGVATLVYVVPVALGTLHQLMAMLLLTTALIALHTLRDRLMLPPGARSTPP